MIIILDLGLACWAICDWRTRSVPAWPFDCWCVLVGAAGLWDTPARWWAPLLWGGGLTLWSSWSQGLGSADVWLMATLSTQLPLTTFLSVVLLACCLGLVHAVVLRPATIPLLTHLAFATIMMQLWL